MIDSVALSAAQRRLVESEADRIAVVAGPGCGLRTTLAARLRRHPAQVDIVVENRFVRHALRKLLDSQYRRARKSVSVVAPSKFLDDFIRRNLKALPQVRRGFRVVTLDAVLSDTGLASRARPIKAALQAAVANQLTPDAIEHATAGLDSSSRGTFREATTALSAIQRDENLVLFDQLGSLVLELLDDERAPDRPPDHLWVLGWHALGRTQTAFLPFLRAANRVLLADYDNDEPARAALPRLPSRGSAVGTSRWERHRLGRSFRASKVVANVVSGLGTETAPRTRALTTSGKATLGSAAIVADTTIDAVADNIGRWIDESASDDGRKLGEVAVIGYRPGIRTVARELSARGIPHATLHPPALTRPVEAVLSPLRWLAHPSSRLWLRHTLSLCAGIGEVKARELASTVEGRQRPKLISELRNTTVALSEGQRQELDDLLNLLGGYAAGSSPAPLLDALIDRFGNDAAFRGWRDDASYVRELAQRSDDVVNLVDALDSRAAPPDPPRNAVTLATPHFARAGSWSTVFVLVPVGEQTAESDGHHGEMLRVAAARSNHEVYMCVPRVPEPSRERAQHEVPPSLVALVEQSVLRQILGSHLAAPPEFIEARPSERASSAQPA